MIFLIRTVIIKGLLLLLSLSLYSQTYTISGYVSDKSTGEKLINAGVFDVITGVGTYSNEYGYYSLSIKSDSVLLRVSYIGYQQYETHLKLNKNYSLNIDMEQSFVLKEVEVSAKRSSTEMQSLSVSDVRALPSLGGEQDIMKVMHLLPGIGVGSEGSSDIFVRGGDASQNLILLDGVPIYNINHAYGFLSVFNSFAISHLNVYKGGFPARYIGRLSSVIDVRMREGNMYKFSGNVDISPIAPNFTLEGPIIKGKTSFMFSARRTMIDIILAPFSDLIYRSSGDKTVVKTYFYDTNLKINHIIGDKDRLFFSLYAGKDNYFVGQSDDGNITKKDIEISRSLERYGNSSAVLSWNHIYGDKLFSNVKVYFSRYRNVGNYYYNEINYGDIYYNSNNELSGPEPEIKNVYSYTNSSKLQSINAQADWDWRLNPIHNLRFGVNWQNLFFSPGETSHKEAGVFVSSKIPLTNAINSYIYVEDKINYKKFDANIGLNFSSYFVENKIYPSLQPRVHINYALTRRLSLFSSYSRMNQAIHSLSNNEIDMSSDLLLPSTKNIKPMISEQVVLGTSYLFNKNISLSLEGYYKLMDNLIEYKIGAEEIVDQSNWEELITIGKGKSYGIELLLEKKSGLITGWMSYVLSKTDRVFPELNNGRPFPFKYDRRHNFSIVGIWNYSDNINFSATWVYYTGRAFTITDAFVPSVSSEDDNAVISWVPAVTQMNSYRMPDYHRLDIAANLIKVKKNGVRTWSLGIYNAYNRFNPFNMVLSDKKSINGIPMVEQTSYFPIMPFVSYSYKF